MQVVHLEERSVPEALALSGAALSIAEQQQAAVLTASVVRGPAVILGAMQHAGRVVELRACEEAHVPVYRRMSTGTAAWMGGAGLVLSLALPHVAWIEADATARTLFNRNVRSFLRAFSRAGAMAHYFGREWISLKQRPGALLGYDVTRTGEVLIEVITGFDQSIALPAELTTIHERAIDRFSGKTPTSLKEVLPDARIESFGARVIEGLVEHMGKPISTVESIASELPRAVTDARDPLPNGLVPKSLERVPIGYLDVAVLQDEPQTRAWLGGDVLAPRWLYEAATQRADVASLGSVPIDGAKVEDLVRAMG